MHISALASNPARVGIMSDICGIQKPGNKFGPKTTFIDSLDSEQIISRSAEHSARIARVLRDKLQNSFCSVKLKDAPLLEK